MKNGTMGDKTQGGDLFFLSVSRTREEKRLAIGSKIKEQKNRKDRITYVDKSTHRVR